GKRSDPYVYRYVCDVGVTACFSRCCAVAISVERRIEEDSIEDAVVRVFIECIACGDFDAMHHRVQRDIFPRDLCDVRLAFDSEESNVLIAYGDSNQRRANAAT